MSARTEWFKFRHDAVENNEKGVGRVTSPYDVPEAFRVTPLGDGRVALEFRYMDRAEPRRSINLGSDAKVEIGSSTKRLFLIEFKPSGDHGSHELLSAIHRIIHQLAEKDAYRQQGPWNYRATRESVDRSLPRVSERLADVLVAEPAH